MVAVGWLWRTTMGHTTDIVSIKESIKSRVDLSTAKFGEVERRLDAGRVKMDTLRTELRSELTTTRDTLSERLNEQRESLARIEGAINARDKGGSA